MGDTSIRWIPYAERLGDNDVYDIMGDVGASEPSVGFGSAADYADWLHQTVRGLGLIDPTMVGASLGGYIVLSYAMARPVASTIAFDPVGVVKIRPVGFTAQGLGWLVASVAPGSIRRLLARRLRQPLLLDKPGLRLYGRGQRHHPLRLPPLPVFTDEQLASIRGRLRVVAGGDGKVFDVERLVDRINALPGAEADLIPGAGHALNATHFDECLAAVRSELDPARPPDKAWSRCRYQCPES